VRFAHSWLVNKIIALSVSLYLLYMVKHKVLLDKRRSRSWTLLLVIGSCIYYIYHSTIVGVSLSEQS